MKPGGGGNKGRQFERDVARILSLWWSNGEDEDCFWRTDSSGARATTRRKKGKPLPSNAGDIKNETESAKKFSDTFFIEVKRGYNKRIDILDILDKPKKKNILLDWFHKAEDECHGAGKKFPIIIFKRNHGEICVIFDSCIGNTMYANSLYGSYIYIEDIPNSLCITSLKNFLNNILRKDRL